MKNTSLLQFNYATYKPVNYTFKPENQAEKGKLGYNILKRIFTTNLKNKNYKIRYGTDNSKLTIYELFYTDVTNEELKQIKLFIESNNLNTFKTSRKKFSAGFNFSGKENQYTLVNIDECYYNDCNPVLEFRITIISK